VAAFGLWMFMVDITIVFMGFINQHSHNWGLPHPFRAILIYIFGLWIRKAHLPWDHWLILQGILGQHHGVGSFWKDLQSATPRADGPSGRGGTSTLSQGAACDLAGLLGRFLDALDLKHVGLHIEKWGECIG